MSLQLRQDVATVRLSPARAPELYAVDVVVDTSSSVQAATLLADDFSLDELESLARAELAELAERLPPEVRPELVTEAGALEQTVRRDDQIVAERAVRYLLSRCRGVVFPQPAPHQGRHDGQRTPMWTSTIEAHELPGDIPVVLAPAALLALIVHLDVMDDDEPCDGGYGAAVGPIVVRTTASPYPPHTSPADLVTPQELLVDEPLPPPQLRRLFRPESWSRPAGALIEDNLGSLMISCEAAGEAPPSYVVLEELVSVSTGSARARWLARAGIRTDGQQIASRTDLMLDFDPLRMLETCHGALSGVQVGVVGSPLAVERYGFAPFLLVSDRLVDLVG